MSRYHSRRERRSRLSDQESKRLMRQSLLLIIIGIILLIGFVFAGIPLLFKVAIYLGDLRSSSGPLEIQDTIPPATPQLNTLPTATVSATLSLTGFAEAQAQVDLYHNGIVADTTTVSETGEFTLNSVSLDQNLNHFYVIARDNSGNQSLPSSTQTVIFDSQAPNLLISTPQDGQQFYGTNEAIIMIKGTTDPDVSVQINNHAVVVSSDGSFTDRLSLNEGNNVINVVATDSAGNQAQIQLSVSYTK